MLRTLLYESGNFVLPRTTTTKCKYWLLRQADWREVNATFAIINGDELLTTNDAN